MQGSLARECKRESEKQVAHTSRVLAFVGSRVPSFVGFDGFAVEINKISGSEGAETPSKAKTRHVGLEACCEMSSKGPQRRHFVALVICL